MAKQVSKTDYSDLFTKIKMLKRDDDWKLFDLKVGMILQAWKKSCSKKEDVVKSVKKLYRRCVDENELATKTIILLSNDKFTNESVHDENLRNAFVKHLFKKFIDASRKIENSDNDLRAFIKILGYFYFKTKDSFLLVPLTNLLFKLVSSPKEEDIKLFSLQCLLNGDTFKEECKTKWSSILMEVRLRLLSRQTETIEKWLLFILELNNTNNIESCDLYTTLTTGEEFKEFHDELQDIKEQNRLRNLAGKTSNLKRDVDARSPQFEKKEVPKRQKKIRQYNPGVILEVIREE